MAAFAAPANHVVGVAAAPGGGGWEAYSDGAVVSWGGAPSYGGLAGNALNQPIVGIAAAPSGGGYWLVASDGGIFTFGSAGFFGSEGGHHLNQPIVGMAAASSGGGYWLVASDGGIFTFGSAPFYGSEGGQATAGEVTGVAVPHSGSGYLLVNAAGAVSAFGPNQMGTPAAGLFSSTSPFNQAISSSAVASASVPPVISEVASGPTADVYAFGMPVFTDVTAATPTYHVTCSEAWGVCPLSEQPVPVPADATPSSGSDSAMAIVDPATHLDYEFWQAHKVNGQWTASWGAVMSTLGIGDRDIYGNPGATGSGISSLEGTAMISELQQGNIPHALSISSSFTCPTFVYPAVKSDGTTSPPNCIPEGSRVELDPAINLAAIPGITPFELTVGRALQTYGAFVKDSGGAPMAVSFQEPPANGPDPYAALGAPGDYYNMPHLPWASLRAVSG